MVIAQDILVHSLCVLAAIDKVVEDTLKIVIALYIVSGSDMAAIPQGAFAACKARENRECPELTPVKYNSKLMNSIWGMYNRYSPYNFKKSNDTTPAVTFAGDQRFSVGLPASAMDKKFVAHKGVSSQQSGQSWDIGLPHTCTY